MSHYTFAKPLLILTAIACGALLAVIQNTTLLQL